MTGVDLALIVILLAFVAWGFVSGIIYAAGSVVGAIIALAVASRSYGAFGSMLEVVTFGNAGAADILAFIVIVVVISQSIGALAWALSRAFGVLSIIPGLGIVNRLGGAVIGFIAGLLIIGVIVVYSPQIIGPGELADKLDASAVASIFRAAAHLISWASSDALGALR